jgi:DNA-binding response OmpR family regulator
MTRPPDGSKSNAGKEHLCVIGEADPFLAQLLQRFVEKSGFRSRIAQSGEAVLSYAAGEGVQGPSENRLQDLPALVVLDPELPGKVRGWEAAQRIASGKDTCTIPIILCAWLNEAESQSLVGQTFNHLQKPDLHYEDFLKALSAVGIITAP